MDATTSQVRFAFAFVVPIQRALQQLGERKRHLDQRLDRVRTCFQQRDVHMSILAQPTRQHAARRAPTDDDVVRAGEGHIRHYDNVVTTLVAAGRMPAAEIV